MFGKHPYIPEEHKITLRSVIAQHNIVTEPLLAQLYLVALNKFKKTGDKVDSTIYVQFIEGAGGIVSGATDERTGIYVQLAGAPGSQTQMLTVGQKWAAQAQLSGMSQVISKHW